MSHWHRFHIQFWCIGWNSASHLYHVCMSYKQELLPRNSLNHSLCQGLLAEVSVVLFLSSYGQALSANAMWAPKIVAHFKCFFASTYCKCTFQAFFRLFKYWKEKLTCNDPPKNGKKKKQKKEDWPTPAGKSIFSFFSVSKKDHEKFPAEERKPAKASFITAVRTPVDHWFKQPLWFRWGFQTRPVLTLLLANQWRGESSMSSA